MNDKYISVKVLEEIMRRHKPEYGQDKSKERYAYIEWLGILNAIRRECQPIEAAPVRKGKWKMTEASPHRLYCDRCYKTAVPNVEWVEIYNLPINFCPNCGADMRGEQDE